MDMCLDFRGIFHLKKICMHCFFLRGNEANVYVYVYLVHIHIWHIVQMLYPLGVLHKKKFHLHSAINEVLSH